MIAVLPALLAIAAFAWLHASPLWIEKTGVRSIWMLAALVVFFSVVPSLIWALRIGARRHKDINAISASMDIFETTESDDELSTIADPDMH